VWPKLKTKRFDEPAAAALPNGVRIYTIGDVHGCVRELDKLTQLIAADMSALPCPESLIILLGDYIDRGPHSAHVLDRLATCTFPAPFLPLRGNHEQMLIRFLEDPSQLTTWRRFGGLETLHSFNIEVSKIRTASDCEYAHREFMRVFPAEWAQLLLDMPSSFALGSYFFCHAGIKPGVSLAQQQDQHLLWIRDEFLSSRVDHGKRIVHGHTPVENVDVLQNRINIDTGAYLTGTLSCLVLEGDETRILRT
jgi:serine/threonine protein phosphatase 1